MIGHFKRHYQKLQFGHKAILASVFIVGSLVSLFSSLFASSLPFQDDLPTLFSSLNFSTGNFSQAHFNQGGNDFAGIIFWLTGETLSTPETISINGGTQIVSCSGHLRGLYYNNMRGWRLWPLDQDSLSILSGQGSGYNTLTLSGGFYTNCTGVSGYSPASNEIFGYIAHTRSGITMQMVAGVEYDFTDNIVSSGSPFSDSLITTGGTYSGWLWDNYGGIAQVSSGQAATGLSLGICGNGIVDGTESCDDGDVDNDDICSNACTWSLTGGMCNGFSAAPTTITLGTTSTFICSGASITGYTLTGYILTFFSGSTAVSTSQVFTSATSYTRTTGAALPLGTYTATCTVLANNGVGPQCATNVTLAVIFTGDIIAPTLPVLSIPTSGAGICSTGTSPFSWSASVDAGGLSGYRYIIQHASGTIYSGIVGSGTTGVTLLPQNMLLGNYLRNVQAFDLSGNTSTSTTGTFIISPNYCSTGIYGTGIQIIGSLSSIVNASLDTVYSSEIFYIRGLTGSTLISTNLGTLIVNGTGIGTTGMITATIPLRIELISSDEYDDTVTATITVAGVTGAFSVTTKESACNLSNAQEDTISQVYDLLKDEYNGNTSLFNDFLATFQSILGDEVDISEDCSLEYLLDLINDDLDNADVDTSNHIAPNCKEYLISYDDDEEAYYSPMMKNRYYFINRETLIRHIDYYNPGDCHINTYGNASWSDNRNTETIHIAPNGKIYHMQSANGGYTSSDFAGSKYFDNLSTMTAYIDSHNPAKNMRDHQVDTDFTPITYLAPNSKEYRIYKTSRGYMSYKLMKVRYFSSLAEIEHYIDWNNPVKK